MKVNLNFSVDIDRVPDEIWRLICGLSDELKTLSDELKMVDITDGNPYYANKQVDDIRKSLVPVDSALEEVQTLIVGYQAALTQIMSGDEEQSHTGTLASPTADTIAGWDKTLSDMREQLGGDNGESNEEG